METKRPHRHKGKATRNGIWSEFPAIIPKINAGSAIRKGYLKFPIRFMIEGEIPEYRPSAGFRRKNGCLLFGTYGPVVRPGFPFCNGIEFVFQQPFS